MGGKSTSTQSTNQTSTTNPWAPAQDTLHGILGQLGTGLANTGVTGRENDALYQLMGNSANPYAGQIGNFANELLEIGRAHV